MKFKSSLKTFLYGICLGISLLPPGFSAATVAMILGIYEALIDLLNDLFSKKIKQTLKPLTLLGVGALTAIFLFSSVIRATMNGFPLLTMSFFLGLIVGTVPLLYKQMDVKSSFGFKHYLFTLLAVGLTSIFILYQNLNLVDLDGAMSIGKIMFLMVVGMLVSSSLILPGLSGALVLMLLGAYQFLLDSIGTLNLVVLGSVTLGGLLGLIICGKLVKYLMAQHEVVMNAISMGLVIGSIPVVFVREILNADVSAGLLEGIISVILGIAGFVLVHVLSPRPKSG